MNIRAVSTRLLIIGSIVLAYAMFFMDITSDGRFINLGLLNERQNLVILGALMVLVGTILFAASIVAGKGHVPEDIPKTVKPSRPNPLIQKLKGIWAWILGAWRWVNGWRPGIVFRVACASICAINLAHVMPGLPWQLHAIGMAIFLPLSLRNLPTKLAISKTCFWAVAVTLPLNLIFFSSAISNERLSMTLATDNLMFTFVLLCCYFIFKRK